MSQFDKLASVAIQGGGVYGLNLLGQLQAVLDHGYRIVALSGTSAGAIVATLYWAGVPLDVVRAKFQELAGPPNRVTKLLGGRGMRPAKVSRLLRGLDRLAARGEFAPPPGRWAVLCWPVRAWDIGCGLLRVAIDRVGGWKAGGLFPGDEFEGLVDELIRRSPRVAPHLASGRLRPKGPLLTFGDLWALTETADAYFPALTLTAANLTTGGLELIDSTDERYHRVPIATAVRASGGFPAFFTPVPVDLPGEAGGTRRCRLVDGGVICNFPAFVFSRWARVEQLGRHERYRTDVMRPWVNVGLRLTNPPASEEVSTLPKVIGRVVGLLTGGGRTILESRLAADTVERYTPCEQPFGETGWPVDYGLLGFDRLTPKYVTSMWEAGQRHANRCLGSLTFDMPPPDAVEGQMDGLVGAVAAAFGDPENRRWQVRATLFVPQGDRLILGYRANMNSPADTDRNLELARGEGLAGYCFVRRSPLLCNLGEFARRAGCPEGGLPFGVPPTAAALVRKDRTWLMSVPVFDPQTASLERLPFDPDPVDGGGAFAELESPLDGALFGVLSVDAALGYAELSLDPDPEEQVTDPRLKLVYDTLLSTAWGIGVAFDACFACDPGGV